MAKKKPEAPKEPAPIGFRPTRPMPEEAGNTPPKPPKPPVDDDDDSGDDGADEKDPFSDPNFDVLMDEIGKRFEVANSLDEAGLQLTTQEVFDRLQSFYPSGYYSTRLVFEALQKMGFKFDDPYKNMNFVWLFK